MDDDDNGGGIEEEEEEEQEEEEDGSAVTAQHQQHQPSFDDLGPACKEVVRPQPWKANNTSFYI
jgi:hypothetical protein